MTAGGNDRMTLTEYDTRWTRDDIADARDRVNVGAITAYYRYGIDDPDTDWALATLTECGYTARAAGAAINGLLSRGYTVAAAMSEAHNRDHDALFDMFGVRSAPAVLSLVDAEDTT